MFAIIIIIIIVWICMWLFYKVMYPRAPKSMMPQVGDVKEPRNCNFCGHSLAEYRGVLETNAVIPESTIIDNNANNTLFFCNYEHQADFHAGRSYQP